MRPTTNTRQLRDVLPILMALVAMCGGCASVSDGLIGDTHENIAPFAQQTFSSLSLERIDIRSDEFIYLRRFADRDASALSNLRGLLARADEFRDEIVYYSVSLLKVSEMQGTETERIEALIELITDEERTQFIRQAELDQSFVDSIVAAMGEETDLLGALVQMQPLIDAAGSHFESLLRKIEEEAIVEARRYLDDQIQAAYGQAVAYITIQERRRDELLAGMTLLRQYRLGTTSAWAELKSANIVFDRSLIDASSPSDKQLAKIEEYFLDEMENEQDVSDYLAIDVAAYLASRQELDHVISGVMDGLNLARVQVLAWSRAHKAMADGVRDPGKWLKIAADASEVAANASTAIK